MKRLAILISTICLCFAFVAQAGSEKPCDPKTGVLCLDSSGVKQVCCVAHQYCSTRQDAEGEEIPVCRDFPKASTPSRIPAAISMGSVGPEL